ncbi:hypothetical protein [Planococcus salinus]|uniref:YtxH domain-containing protein n=1 Tax=Planococcus salinus TaxID=1848460 RepID=A0A3M8P7K7_9BACL|nr:hypothetical protein [Planococcus salinus]RNF39678.1 hypothetical protein EEX84_06810 [Planococcus salinus]
MARKSGGLMGKLVLLGIGAAIGSAMAQKKVDSNGTGTQQTSNVKENMKKSLERLNEQSGGMVDRIKPGVSKAVEAVKEVIDSQQKMMDKEKDTLDKANQVLQKEVGDSSDKKTTGSSENTSSGSEPSKTGSSSNTAPSGGVYGGSTPYTESLKKDLDEDGSKKDSTFDK